MGLDSTDRLPFGISLKEAYKKIRTWYKSNKSQLKESKCDEYYIASMDLINHLPNINSISDIEIRVILAEIICGNLEWAYHENDGEFKMAAYAHQSLERYGGFQGAFLKEDIETLKILPIWNYLCKGQKSQLSRYSETGD